MKKTIAYTLIILGLLISSSAFSKTKGGEEKLIIDKSYPYGLLVERADSVKILFSENEQGINCSVELENDGELQQSDMVFASKNKFNQKPLSACLARSQAKNWLALTF